MTSLLTVHKEQLEGEAAQISSEDTTANWNNATSGIPQDRLCPWCGDIFKWKGSKKRHIKLVHQGSRNCPHCEVPYCSQRILTQHLAIRRGRGSCYLEEEERITDSDTSLSGDYCTDEKEESESD